MTNSEWYSRTRLLITDRKFEKLQSSHILVAGLGGVGGYAAEQLARAGIGQLTLIDSDAVEESNINRQIIALNSTIGKNKADVIESRIMDINPDIKLNILKIFIDKDNITKILNNDYNYVVDAIDTLTPKVEMIRAVLVKKIPLISSMGSGGKTDPQQVLISDVSNSHHCKFAYIVRKYLHKYGIKSGFKVVFSPEPIPKHAVYETDGSGNKRSVVGTISYMPAIFGCFCAASAVMDILEKSE